MDNKYHQAGKSTREMAFRRWRNAVIVGLVVIGIALIILFLISNSKALGLSGGVILILLLAIWLMGEWYEGFGRRSRKREKRAVRGARAEETIGFLLDSMGPEFFILHDIESPFGNIDHIVIGEFTGVFLIETKSHNGKVGVFEGRIMVNGKQPEKDFIKQTLNNTYWLKERITRIAGIQPWITPILVFTNAFVPYSQPIKNIHVINKKYLSSTIRQKMRVDETITRIWKMKEAIAEDLMKKE
ncbi:MAG: nuclease-related domain-containing protein [Anaerolineales bacterium]